MDNEFSSESFIPYITVYNTGVSGSMSGYQAWRTDVKWDSMPPPLLDTLPPPSEVFKGKKRKKSPAERSVMSVENYIQELRKKQSSIDQLKTMKWGGYSVYEVGIKEGIQSDGSMADQERDTFFTFLDDEVGCSEQDMPIFSFSPPRSPGGVVFPWMSPQEDVTTCYLDRSREGWGTARGFL
ncbi:protein INCA1 isoform X2 [Rhinoderma darwinii]|uniref:protein INCA1 isoform X2 n=1 Tax=Rhinoderma darwinii TaxID=43563 RepID=UPI003F67712D